MRYLLVDAHSVIFSWAELRELHRRNPEIAREELTRRLTSYQDATGVHVVVVFDGRGARSSADKAPGGVQVFYSGGANSADSIIERLAAKYAGGHEITVATNDRLEQQTVITFGGMAISVEALRKELDAADRDVSRRIRRWRNR
jgi:predicted RNA-binding protein with PIN domain